MKNKFIEDREYQWRSLKPARVASNPVCGIYTSSMSHEYLKLQSAGSIGEYVCQLTRFSGHDQAIQSLSNEWVR